MSRPTLGVLPPSSQDPPCLARTPSGTLYIPGDLSKTLNSPHHKSELSRNAYQDERKNNPDRCHMPPYNTSHAPVLPVRTNLRRPLSGQFVHSRFQLRKTLPSKCSWRCTAIVLIPVTLALLCALGYFIAVTYPTLKQSSQVSCPVMVEDMEIVQDKSEQSPSTLPSKTLPPKSDSFAELQLGRKHVKRIPSFSHWNFQFQQRNPSLVKFNYSLPHGANIGVYGRRNGVPSHTKYDFVELLQPRERSIKSSKEPLYTVEFIQFLDRGLWYISLYNDGNQSQEITFIPHLTDESSLPCPYDCHGHGTCILGSCTCNPDYAGDSCAYRVCPILCNSKGQYLNGECICSPGWKGRECQLRDDECEISDCSGHGDCLDGQCRCFPGYKGQHCEEVDCLDPDCSGHGVCVQGLCLCRKGWKGADCGEPDSEALRCLPDCSGHGNFDLEMQRCNCDERWTGPDCSQERCGLDCGEYGRCQSGLCVCLDGWTGVRCTERLCDPRCQEHGQCKNGTCLCIQGWNGRHCTIEGCPKNCHNHGECVMIEDEWQCECEEDWDGLACNIALERRCSDQTDNDNDGLVDCADTECCTDPACENSPLCYSAADPLDILLRKQPPAVTASFFQRMQFLIEEDSVQSYAHKSAFNDSLFWSRFNSSRASVIRGQVVSTSGTGLVGIRVGITSDPLYGFTLTRETGWFDLMVNGGGAAKLQFQREPFLPAERIVTVPWNEIVVMDPIVMVLKEDERELETKSTVCLDHDFDTMKPVVLATWKHGFQGGCPEKSAILVESQVVQESLPIPGCNFHLVYHSSRVGGYLSTIQLQLTPDLIPPTLRLIHLRISIEGILFEKQFEGDPGIKYTYAWNRRNVYRQKVYGVTPATVHVGYEYSNCPQVIWEAQTTQVSGHDMSISEIGGWNVDIHHRYNFHEGILQKGDGSNIYLKNKPKVLVTTMGDGNQRPLHCSSCNGVAKEQQLLAPVALASAPDGSIYVGDFNLVRKITPQGMVSTIVELSAAQVAYRYRLAIGPLDGRLYISDPERHQILVVLALTDIPDVKNNIEPIVGNGGKCLPGDKLMCGDGRPAKEARLAYPKGLAISPSNEIYIADGTNIRMVDKAGIIHTIVGDYYHKSHWKPMPCGRTITLSQVNLRWPTELALNPLDGSLHILDDHMILKLTQDKRLKIIAGRPLQCPSTSPTKEKNDMATEVFLDSPQSIAFAPNGDLYVAESDSQMINWVRIIGSDGRIRKFAGAESKCSCLDADCKCFVDDHYLAATSKLSTIASITVTSDGLLHICDQGNLRIRSVIAPLPKPNELNEYEIYSPETQDVYVFNRHGQHISTKNILTQKAIFNFSYNVNTSFGKLSTVTDAEGNKIYILRDYSNQVNTIENTQGGKCRLEMSRMRMLQSFTTPSNYKTTFDYHGSTSLLRSKIDSTGKAYMNEYDEYGRLMESILPSGQTVKLSYNLSVKGASVTITRDDKRPVTMMIKGLGVTTRTGLAEEKIMQYPDGGMMISGQDSSLIEIETVANPLLTDGNPVLGEIFPLPTKLKATFNEEMVKRFEWRYYLRREGKSTNKQVGRKLKVNGENLLNIEFDREKQTEKVLDKNQIPLVTVHYDAFGHPLQWVPSQNLTGTRMEYDKFGRLIHWERGPLNEKFSYDIQGRLAEIRYSDDSSILYKYEDGDIIMPTELILPRGSRYLLQYDQSGSLQAVVTPNGHKHEIATQSSIGFYKLLYLSPGVKHPYVIHFNDQGQVLAKIYPQNLGRVVYSYNDEGRLQTIFCGDERTDYAYHDQSSLVRSIAITSSNMDYRIDFRYQGVILKEERIRYNSRSGLDGAKFKYKFEGRQLIVEADINGKPLQELKYRYNSESGVLEQVQQFLIHRPKINSVFLQDDMRHYSKTIGFDMLGRITILAMTLWNKEIFSLSLSYDNRSRVKQTVIKVGRDGSAGITNYNYTVDSFLEEVSGSQSWKYTYDINGNMKSILNGPQQLSLRYDDGDRLIGYGDVELYGVDGRGFVIQRGEEKFRFNAKSQLIHAFELHQYEVYFYYDAMNRLIAKKDHRGNLTQFFYANPKNPYQMTHTHDPKDSKTHIYLYDTDNHLIYIQEGPNKYYVASDHLGTPLAVFNNDGKLIKEIIRSPFGKILTDTNPEFYIPIDFREGIRDPITQIVFFKGRAYDPLCSQWLTPNWEDVPQILIKPYNIHLYRFNGNNPINLHPEINDHLTDFSSWITALGFDTNKETILPESIKTISTRNTQVQTPFVSQGSIPVISGLSCTAELMDNEFKRLSTVSQFDVTIYDSIVPTINKRLANLMSVLGDGILISKYKQKALVHVVNEASPILRDVIASVFNDTYMVDLHFSLHGQDSFFFVQEDRTKAQGDWDQIQRLGTMFNVTMHSVDASDTMSRNGQMDLRIHSTSVVLNIRYGSTLLEEKQRLIRHARRRAIEDAWQQEEELLRNGHHGSHDWTKSEREELFSSGMVSKYVGADIHDIQRYPELTDDPSNVNFKKESSRKRRGRSRRPKR